MKASHVTLKVYNQQGVFVNSIFEGDLDAGNYRFEWNGKNAAGQALAAGMYSVVMMTDNSSRTIKLIKH